MLTDRENRPALAVGLASHAVSMAILAFLAPTAEIGSAFAGLAAMAAIFFTFATAIAGIAWVVEAPLVRKLGGAKSNVEQLAGCMMFLIGMAGVFIAIGATWKATSPWSFAGLALLSGCASIRQFRVSVREDRDPLPEIRLVR